MPHYLHFTKLGMMDVPITFFILLMIYFFWIGQEKPVYLFFSGAVLGLAYLMKGFSAFLGPVIIFAYCIFSGSWRHLFKRQFIMGTLFAFVIIFLWHLILYCLTGPEAIKNYFGFHIFSRATSAIGYHTGGINFYQKAIFNKNKPWSVLAYASVFYILWQALKKRDSIAILILSWIAASYVLYSVITTKLHWYIIPIYPALALSTAIFLERFFKNKAFKFSLAAILIIMLIQVPISWAFKLDFNPDVKKAAGHAKELKDNGSFIYFYKKCDNKELFYYRDFSMLISDKNIPSKDAISSGKIYCIIRLDDIKQAEREYNYIFQPVRYSGDIAIARIRNKEN